jgi:hypothetical protein
MGGSLATVAADLSGELERSVPLLRAITETDSEQSWAAGKWSRKQVLGHLVDSALNNVHRFVRGQLGDELRFPDYDQPLWVRAGGYQERAWGELIELWTTLNRHLVEVIRRIPAERGPTPCRIGESGALTLEFIVKDYMRHLRHHLRQILDPEDAAGRSHPPFA